MGWGEESFTGASVWDMGAGMTDWIPATTGVQLTFYQSEEGA